MKNQRGFSLSHFLIWGVLLVVLAIYGMKVVPSAMEYSTILKDAKRVAAEASPQASVAEIRAAFDRYATVDNIKSVKAQDLDITKSGKEVVIEFSYSQKVPLGGPASLLLEYQGSTSGKP